MDTTPGPESDEPGAGLLVGARAGTSDPADDAEYAWDEFIPDADDAADGRGAEDETSDDYESAYAEEHEEEDLELAQEDLALRWDAFGAEDPEDAEDAAAVADAARITAALERMERRVMGVDDEVVEDPTLTSPAADETTDLLVDDETDDDGGAPVDGELHEVGDAPTGGVAAAAFAADVAWSSPPSVAGRALSNDDADSAGTAGAGALTAEDRRRLDEAFARMEEALFGDRNEDDVAGLDDRAPDSGEPEAWLSSRDSLVADIEEGDAEEDEERALTVAVDGESDEPDVWLDGDGDPAYANDEEDGEPAYARDEEDEDPAYARYEENEDPAYADYDEDEGAAVVAAAVSLDAAADDAADHAPPTAPDPLEVAAASETASGAALHAEFAETGVWPDGDSSEADTGLHVLVPADLSDLDTDDRETEDDERDPDAGVPVDRRGRRTARAESDVRRLVLLACLFFAVVIGAVVLHFGHVSSSTSAPPATAATPRAASPAEIARLESAITDVQSASSGAQSGLSGLASFPTPARVATIINPYVDSLQLYAALAPTVDVAKGARSEAQTADLQVHQDIAFLGTINDLPPVQLGSFIEEFFARSTQLQSTMDTLRFALNPTAAH